MTLKKKINYFGLTEELTSEIRGFSAPALARQVIENEQLKNLTDLALSDDKLLSSRAMWVFAHCCDLNYESTKIYHDKLISNLRKNDLHNGVIRNTLRLFQQHPVPKKHESFLLDKCFKYISDPAEAIAVRSFAIAIVFNISKPYPELLNELYSVLNHLNVFDEPPGIRSRIKNTIKNIQKVMKL